MSPAWQLIAKHGLHLQAGKLVSERPLTPAEVDEIRPFREAIVKALMPQIERLVPMEPDTLAERIRPAQNRMRAAQDWLRTCRAEGWEPLGCPSRLKPEVLALMTLEARRAESMAASGLRWIESCGGAA